MLVNLDIHILALNETKPDALYPKELTHIPGYKQVRHDRSCNGGGVSIYIQDSIKFRHQSDIPAEELGLISKSFIVLALYKPPSDLVNVFTRLEIAISYLDRENKELLLLGDTNSDLSNKAAGLIIDGNAKHICNLYQLYTLNPPTTIDHIATTCSRNIAGAGACNKSLSDDYMV